MPDEKNSLCRAFHDAYRHGSAAAFSRSGCSAAAVLRAGQGCRKARARREPEHTPALGRYCRRDRRFRLSHGRCRCRDAGVVRAGGAQGAVCRGAQLSSACACLAQARGRGYLRRLRLLSGISHPRAIKSKLGGQVRTVQRKDKRCGQGDRRRVPQL
ncbi:unknown [Firmicutes bacterium CAG:240]|nr:unknown [Firmicutes bacterium CAG:240]